jgi:hypothetical protein
MQRAVKPHSRQNQPLPSTASDDWPAVRKFLQVGVFSSNEGQQAWRLPGAAHLVFGLHRIYLWNLSSDGLQRQLKARDRMTRAG